MIGRYLRHPRFIEVIAVYLAVIEMGCSGSHIPASKEGLTASRMWPNTQSRLVKVSPMITGPFTT
jgi:hypothetical protein